MEGDEQLCRREQRVSWYSAAGGPGGELLEGGIERRAGVGVACPQAVQVGQLAGWPMGHRGKEGGKGKKRRREQQSEKRRGAGGSK